MAQAWSVMGDGAGGRVLGLRRHGGDNRRHLGVQLGEPLQHAHLLRAETERS